MIEARERSRGHDRTLTSPPPTQRKIKGIDSEENMGAYFQEGGPWFVLPMIKKAFQNNKSTSRILDDMRRKLELLAVSQGQSEGEIDR